MLDFSLMFLWAIFHSTGCFCKHGGQEQRGESVKLTAHCWYWIVTQIRAARWGLTGLFGIPTLACLTPVNLMQPVLKSPPKTVSGKDFCDPRSTLHFPCTVENIYTNCMWMYMRNPFVLMNIYDRFRYFWLFAFRFNQSIIWCPTFSIMGWLQLVWLLLWISFNIKWIGTADILDSAQMPALCWWKSLPCFIFFAFQLGQGHSGSMQSKARRTRSIQFPWKLLLWDSRVLLSQDGCEIPSACSGIFSPVVKPRLIH